MREYHVLFRPRPGQEIQRFVCAAATQRQAIEAFWSKHPGVEFCCINSHPNQ